MLGHFSLLRRENKGLIVHTSTLGLTIVHTSTLGLTRQEDNYLKASVNYIENI